MSSPRETVAADSALKRISGAVVSYGLYAILAESLFESWNTASPLRWAHSMTLLAYAAVTALIWRRAGAWVKAAASGIVLLILTVLSVWRVGPVGASSSVTVVGIPVATLTVAGGVALAAYALLILPFIPKAGVVGTAALSMYSLAALAAKLAGRTWPGWSLAAYLLLALGFAAVLYQLFRAVTTGRASLGRWVFSGVTLLIAALVILSGNAGWRLADQPQPVRALSTSRAPGLRRQPPESLSLSAPRTFEMAHLQPEHIAAALGRDPARIFEFVRDQISYEAYIGGLRGPRGTLMAMSGNSVDRAWLLASLLQAAGQRVRYVRGVLPERDAAMLVASMWTAPPQGSPARGSGDSSPALRAARDTLVAGVRRDFKQIGDQLKKTGYTADPLAASPLSTLVKEAREHTWIQWARNGNWVDLDASFADAAPGRAFAAPRETLERLPDALFHQVTLQLRLEEMTAGTSSSRELLTHTVRAADLSGVDLVLVHVPENWKGPASSLESGIGSAIGDTGRVKAVLLVPGGKDLVSEPFQQKLKTKGVGAVRTLLGGEGTRRTTPLATAETLEISFTSPDGRKDSVTREIFDIVGKAARSARRALSAEELSNRTQAAEDITHSVYSAFFTTGRIDAGHLEGVIKEPAANADQEPDVLLGLRRFGIMFAAASDAFLDRLGPWGETQIRFYQDSPRLTIAGLSARSGSFHLVLDLRRDYARAVVLGPHPDNIVAARVIRGVVDGALERAIAEHVTGALRQSDARWQSRVSTSGLFERAEKERVPVIVLPKDSAALGPGLPDDVLARLREETAAGFLLVAPQRPISVDGRPRYAWWRIDPRSGEAIAVSDEGLYAVTIEYQVQRDKTTHQTRMVYREVVDGVPRAAHRTGWFEPASARWNEIFRDFRGMRDTVSRGTQWGPPWRWP